MESTGGDSAHVSGDAGTEGGSWVHIHRHHLDLDETSISFHLKYFNKLDLLNNFSFSLLFFCASV